MKKISPITIGSICLLFFLVTKISMAYGFTGFSVSIIFLSVAIWKLSLQIEIPAVTHFFKNQKADTLMTKLTALIVYADKHVDITEMRKVRVYYHELYETKKATKQYNAFMKELKKCSKNSDAYHVEEIARELSQCVNHEIALTIFHILFGIAVADKSIANAELELLRTIASFLGLNREEYESIEAMYIKSKHKKKSREQYSYNNYSHNDYSNSRTKSYNYTNNTNYTILEISPSASDKEVKKAYYKLAKKHHPDKVKDRGAASIKAANEKFQSIQNAYDEICQLRGM